MAQRQHSSAVKQEASNAAGYLSIDAENGYLSIELIDGAENGTPAFVEDAACRKLRCNIPQWSLATLRPLPAQLTRPD